MPSWSALKLIWRRCSSEADLACARRTHHQDAELGHFWTTSRLPGYPQLLLLALVGVMLLWALGREQYLFHTDYYWLCGSILPILTAFGWIEYSSSGWIC